jgi:hypothetical protein
VKVVQARLRHASAQDDPNTYGHLWPDWTKYPDPRGLDGGTGTDRCDGGPDTDTATTCETLMSIP